MATRRHNSRRSPARRNTKKRSTGIPKWLWMLIGIAVGVVIAYSRDIGDLLDKKPRAQQATAVPQQPAVSVKVPATKPKPAEVITLIPPAVPPKYDFYERLPKDEVIIPQRDYQQFKKPKAPLQDKPATAVPSTQAKGKYFIQVGSFRKQKDAERRKATLILKGMRPKVEGVTTDSGKWYRVRLGPFSSRDKVNQLRTELHSQKIKTLLVNASGQ